MIHYDKIPQRGDFNFQTLVGPHKVSGKALHDTRGFFGLNYSKTSAFGCLYSDDGETFAAVRSLLGPQGVPNPITFLYLSTLIDGKNIRIDKELGAKQAMTLYPQTALDGDIASWKNLEDDEGNSWHITASGDSFSWHEEGLYSLKGKLLGQGMQWYLPGVDWGTFYVSQVYAVEGVCQGRNVKGCIAMDQIYMAEGGAIHHKKDLIVNNNMHVIWWTFANIFKDGSYEFGSIMVGHDNLGFAIITNQDGKVTSTSNIEGLVTHKENSYFAKTAKIVIENGDEWEFRPDAKDEMIDFVGGFPVTAQQCGQWRRVGDERELDYWLGWGETDRRNGTARNVFGSDL
ncbi:MAG: hypothetical protein COA43_00180 [Robiginitomaculum sp.]|nr:MAG: hypothetical protein COA43_00180 [Robiginitomaculum sp.]